MPRKTKGPRLYLQPERRDSNGKLTEYAVWVIRDGNRKRSTGFGADEIGEAEKRLAEYIAEKHDPAAAGTNSPERVPVADAIALYSEDIAPKHSRPKDTAARLEKLLDFFGTMTVAEIKGRTCRKYAESRGAPVAARRELEDLRAALNYAFKERLIDRPVAVTLPEKSEARERWLERDEAAKLIWAAWRLRQKYKGNETDRKTAQHVARFILVALYTGSRAGPVCRAAIRPTIRSAYIDLDAGLFYRKPPGERQTKKRAPPVPLPDRLLAHLRRWERLEISKNFVVEWNGKPVTKINKAFRAAREAAGFGNDVIPHTLRHTAATWLARNGVPISEAADYVGMSTETFERVYRHHAPGYQEQARNMITQKRLPRQLSDRNDLNQTEKDAV